MNAPALEQSDTPATIRAIASTRHMVVGGEPHGSGDCRRHPSMCLSASYMEKHSLLSRRLKFDMSRQQAVPDSSTMAPAVSGSGVQEPCAPHV